MLWSDSIPACSNLIPHTDLLAVTASCINKKGFKKYKWPYCGVFKGEQQISIKCSVWPVSDTWDYCDRATHKTTVLCGSDHPSVAQSKQEPCKWEERSKLVIWAEVATEQGKGGERGEKHRNVFSWRSEAERRRLKDCSGICFHFRKVLWLMCISWLLASACFERETESERVRRGRREN